QRARELQRFLKVMPSLNQLDALSQHGAVLLDAVALRDDNHSLQSEQSGCHPNALTVITPRCRDHALKTGPALLEPFDVDQFSAQLKRANRRVVLVLDLDLSFQALIRKRPAVLESRQHIAIDHCLNFANLDEKEKRHGSSIPNLNWT